VTRLLDVNAKSGLYRLRYMHQLQEDDVFSLLINHFLAVNIRTGWSYTALGLEAWLDNLKSCHGHLALWLLVKKSNYIFVLDV
jgi:hypothetical protein